VALLLAALLVATPRAPAGAAALGGDRTYLPLISRGSPLVISQLNAALGPNAIYQPIGELHNLGSTPLISTTITVQFDGGTTTVEPFLTATLPGRTNYFFVSRVSGVLPTGLAASVNAAVEDTLNQYQALTIVTMNVGASFVGSVSGTIRNDSASTVVNAQIIGVLRDQAGNLVGAYSAFGTPIAAIAPGETVSYYIPAFAFRNYPAATAEVYAQGVVAP
jgi:hypothetical protein